MLCLNQDGVAEVESLAMEGQGKMPPPVLEVCCKTVLMCVLASLPESSLPVSMVVQNDVQEENKPNSRYPIEKS